MVVFGARDFDGMLVLKEQGERAFVGKKLFQETCLFSGNVEKFSGNVVVGV